MPVPAEVSESGQLILGLLTLLGLIVTAGFGFLSVRATQTRNHARTAATESFKARDQLENNHDSNLRDDLDEKFTMLGDTLTAFGRDLGGMKADIRALHRDNATAREDAMADRNRLTKHIDRALTEAVATIPKETS